MKKLLMSFAAGVLAAGALSAVQATPARAATVSPPAAIQLQDGAWKSGIEEVRHRRRDGRRFRYERRRHGDRYRYRRGGHRYHYGGWWYASPFWLAPFYAAPYYGTPYYAAPVYRPAPVYRYGGSRHVRYCLNRYRSYNPRTDLFLSYSGYYKRCRSPWRP